MNKNINPAQLRNTFVVCGAIIIGAAIYDHHQTRIHNQRMRKVDDLIKSNRRRSKAYAALNEQLSSAVENAKFWLIVTNED